MAQCAWQTKPNAPATLAVPHFSGVRADGFPMTSATPPGLLDDARRAQAQVLNGIAYARAGESLLTGKYWPAMLRVRFDLPARPKAEDPLSVALNDGASAACLRGECRPRELFASAHGAGGVIHRQPPGEHRHGAAQRSLAQVEDLLPGCFTFSQPGSLSRIAVHHSGRRVHPDVLQIIGE